jgi:signal transduction histidine kinase
MSSTLFLLLRRRIKNQLGWILHPISVFVVIQILSVTLISLWVIWFVGRQRDLELFMLRFGNPDIPVDQSSGLSVLVIGIVALIIVLVGSVLLFIWGQRQSSFIRQQRSFVSSVTHELRTPLASIYLAQETLLKRELAPEIMRKLVGMSMLDIDRLTKLVNQILISSRLDRGLAMFRDDIRDMNIRDELDSLINTLTYLDENISDRFHIDCPPNAILLISETAFTLILGNLIENSVKYSVKGSPVNITVSLGDEFAHIVVVDQGRGMSKRDVKKAFKMFYRGEESTKTAIPGTGLGLFIVKTSLEQIGGKIKLSSKGSGLGTAVEVYLPLKRLPSHEQ